MFACLCFFLPPLPSSLSLSLSPLFFSPSPHFFFSLCLQSPFPNSLIPDSSILLLFSLTVFSLSFLFLSLFFPCCLILSLSLFFLLPSVYSFSLFLPRSHSPSLSILLFFLSFIFQFPLSYLVTLYLYIHPPIRLSIISLSFFLLLYIVGVFSLCPSLSLFFFSVLPLSALLFSFLIF